MPANSDAVVEFDRILRVDLTAVFDGFSDPFFRRHCREFKGVVVLPQIATEHHAFAATAIIAIGITNLLHG
ncbi:hypothetical protein D3C87_2126110 [compost metagenome]